jgi:small ligand-binding sensory domain FIST
MAESGASSGPDGQFRAAYGAGEGWQDSLQACLEALAAPPEGANLGLVYTTDLLAGDLAEIVARLRAATGIQDWLGTVGTGVSACGLELHDRPAVVVLVGALPAEAFRIVEPVSEGLGDFESRHGRWIAERTPYFGIVHGDPRTVGLPDLVARLSEISASFLVGGLSASRGEMWQVAGEVAQGGAAPPGHRGGEQRRQDHRRAAGGGGLQGGHRRASVARPEPHRRLCLCRLPDRRVRHRRLPGA